MNASKRFQALLRDFLKPELKKDGFSLRGTTFYLFDNDNWGLIEFQRGSKSTQESTIFTVNVGIASRRLSGLSTADWQKSRPSMSRTDWNLRLGFLLGLPQGQKDKWWTLTEVTSISDLAQELVELLRGAAIPEIRRLSSDVALRDYWLSGQGGGLSDRQRVSKLDVLLREIGPNAKLGESHAEEAPESDHEFDDLVTRVLTDAGFTKA